VLADERLHELRRQLLHLRTDGTSGTTWDNLCFVPTTGSIDGAACTTNAGCRSGLCNRYDGVCSRQCCAESDCGPTESCTVYDLDATTPTKICAPRSPTTGTLPLGATCTTADECESETCVPVNPDDVASVRKCSTLCCRNADCTVLPAGGACRAFNGPIAGTLVGACQPN
jgi:hypothetical protein